MIRLKAFSYYEPASIREASEILTQTNDKAFPLAGGTDLLVRMKRGVIRPAVLVNLKRITGLSGIENENDGGLRIGALATIADIETSPLVRKTHPVLCQAAGVLGSQPLRNLATVGGNIGRASPASDMAPALMVLQARVAAQGRSGSRELEIDHVFAGPGSTTLAAGEIMTSFFLPAMAPATGAAYLKMGRRSGGGDCALVGVAALLTLEKAEPGTARIALSSVGPTPLRAKRAEALILSGKLTEERMRQAARAAAEEAAPITDMRCSASYRKEIIEVLTYRALQEAKQKAQGGKAA
ncbi:MAG: xanthine dehydrogenase family protein subunit M [Thermodesulfobacteriota bacterium]